MTKSELIQLIKEIPIPDDKTIAINVGEEANSLTTYEYSPYDVEYIHGWIGHENPCYYTPVKRNDTQ